jgi:hypothetical protein
MCSPFGFPEEARHASGNKNPWQESLFILRAERESVRKGVSTSPSELKSPYEMPASGGYFCFRLCVSPVVPCGLQGWSVDADTSVPQGQPARFPSSCEALAKIGHRNTVKRAFSAVGCTFANAQGHFSDVSVSDC